MLNDCAFHGIQYDPSVLMARDRGLVEREGLLDCQWRVWRCRPCHSGSMRMSIARSIPWSLDGVYLDRSPTAERRRSNAQGSHGEMQDPRGAMVCPFVEWSRPQLQ